MLGVDVNLGIFALVGVIMLVLAGSSFIYLLRLKDRSQASRWLLGFFGCLILSALATILTNTRTPWSWAFAPAQDGLLILGGVFLAQFAYHYPVYNRPGEARAVTVLFGAIGLFALGYSLYFAIDYLSSLPEEIRENRAFYTLTPLTIVLLVGVFFRRARQMGGGAAAAAARPDGEGAVPEPDLRQAWSIPPGRAAQALRNFGLALSLGLVPMVVVLVKGLFPPLLASILFNLGAVLAIGVLMLAYLNDALEPTRITAKLAGISLVAVLLILGIAGVVVDLSLPEPALEHQVILIFIFLVLVSSLLVVVFFPLFFRSTLLEPLDRLLQGVQEANDGDLDVQVAVAYPDEIGYLTQSYNRMVAALKQTTQALQTAARELEGKVAERTEDLRSANTRLDRELRYEQALAACSQVLLGEAWDEERQNLVLSEALGELRVGAQASRAYIFRNFEDPELGLCMGMRAEACAPGVRAQIQNPVNRKFPWTGVPVEMASALASGMPFGGPVEKAFVSTPALLDGFRNQENPLLSIQIFPIFVGDDWWGFTGFDDVTRAREWGETEILMLRTASEMIGSTLQRWQAEEKLRETLGDLEQRVQQRTLEFAQANAALRYEIRQRERFQEELETWLEVERTLAEISTRLVSPLKFPMVIRETLADLAAILQASQALYVQLAGEGEDPVETVIEWSLPGTPAPGRPLGHLIASRDWSVGEKQAHKSIYIRDFSALPRDSRPGTDFLTQFNIHSLVFAPLWVGDELAGFVACTNPKIPVDQIAEKLRPFDVVAGMLSSLLQREALLRDLESKVTERTRELSTFYEMAMLAAEAPELADVLQPSLARIMEISRCEAVCIHLFGDERTVAHLVAQRGVPEAFVPHLEHVHLDGPALEEMSGSGAGEFTPGARETQPAGFDLPGFGAAIFVRLRARGRLQGLLSCYRIESSPFSPYQVSILNAIGEQLGVVVENYRLRVEAEALATLQERQRVARELHDSVTQSLYSLTLFARAGLDAFQEDQRAKLVDSLQMLEEVALLGLKEMRLLLYQMRLPGLETGGLLQALKTRLSQVEDRAGIQTELTIEGAFEFAQPVEQEVFAVISEALNNSLKHARAGQVSIHLGQADGEAFVEVGDDGCGFDSEKAGYGMGIHNMQARAEFLAGRLEIHSRPGEGTRVRLVFPVPNVVEESRVL